MKKFKTPEPIKKVIKSRTNNGVTIRFIVDKNYKQFTGSDGRGIGIE